MKIKNNKEIDELTDNEFTGVVEWCDGMRRIDWACIYYHKHGKNHREDGPAREYFDGDQYWYLNGINYSEKQWKMVVEKIKRDRKILSK
jgi:hypothetical protein